MGRLYDGPAPKPLEPPVDLIALPRVALTAETAIGEYVAAIQARDALKTAAREPAVV